MSIFYSQEPGSTEQERIATGKELVATHGPLPICARGR
jgi:hypothetical protein